MNDDSGDPKNDSLTATETSAMDGDEGQRPHPLDDHDDWSPPSNSWLTPRNIFALLLTLVVSTVLAIGIGLPNSVGAMLGVWIATFFLFGPLWLALFNQDWASRFSASEPEQSDTAADPSQPKPSEDVWQASLAAEPSNEVVRSGGTLQGESPIVATAVHGPASSAESPIVASPVEDGAKQQSVESTEETQLVSYYQPRERQSSRQTAKMSAGGYVIVLLFAVFVGLLVIGGPFLAAAIVWAFGEAS